MNCKNCGYVIDGNFCCHCGQSAKVGRITLAGFINEVTESIFQVDKGFFYTLTALFARPGDSLKDFLNGKRKNHFKPVAYVLTLSTVYFLTSQFTNHNTWLDDLITGWMNGATGQGPKAEFPQIITWFSKNYAYSILLLLPVFSLASYLSFKKFGRNYLEHIVINAYITGQQAIFYTFFAIGGTFIKSDVLEIFPLLIALSYTFLVFWQFFSEGNRMVNIMRSIMTYLLYLIFSFLFLLVIIRLNQW